jgi:hypothetical protein
MITAKMLKTLTSFTARDLILVLDQSGYTECSFETAEFLGITNAGQFAYQVTFRDDAEVAETGKVFLSYDPSEDKVTADF